MSASADDAFEDTAGTVVTNGLFAAVDNTDEWAGFRWQGVTIDQGDTINTAVLSVSFNSTASDEPRVTFYGEDADNAALFTTAGSSISSRTRTTASVNWHSTDLGAVSYSFVAAPDLSAIVQEIVDRGGWANGNSLVIVCNQTPPSDSARDFTVQTYDQTSAYAAKLDIDYTAGGGGGGALPWLYRSFTQTLGAGFGGGAHD